MIRILVDSSSDYPMKEIMEKHLEFIPITITMNDKEYVDGIDLEKNDFFELLVKSNDFPKTAQPSPQSFLSVFQKAKQQGDEVICILLSSELSGTCQSAILAKDMVDYDGIYIIDSLTATYPIKILADYAHRLTEQGLSAPEIVEKVEALRPRIKLFAALDTLEYLSRGGRIPKSVAAIGDMANLKPVITVTEEGKIGLLGKCLGKNKAIAHILKDLSHLTPDKEFPFYSIYSYGTDNCQIFEEKLSEHGYAVNERLQIGATIGSHIGPEAFGIVFVTN